MNLNLEFYRSGFLRATNTRQPRRQKKIVSLLPYKIISAKSFPYDAAAAQGLEIICAHYAAVLGINFSLIHYPKGTDEQAVLGHWPLLVPPLNLNE